MLSQRKVVIIKLAAFVHIGLQRENVNVIYNFVLLTLACTHHTYMYILYLCSTQTND